MGIKIETHNEKKISMADIIEGHNEAKQKEDNFRKRQELKELERIIAKKEKEQNEGRDLHDYKEESLRGWRDRRMENNRGGGTGRREDLLGWSWSSGLEDRRYHEDGGPRGPVLDFKQEIKMPTVEFGPGEPITGGLGAKMMAKMGWKEGEGLGKDRDGIVEPIGVKLKKDKKGVDYSTPTARNPQNTRHPTLADLTLAVKTGRLSEKDFKALQDSSATTDIPGISSIPGDRNRSEPKTVYYCNYCSMRLTTHHVMKEHCMGRNHLKKAPPPPQGLSGGSSSSTYKSNIEVKNPVSLLVELCQKRRWNVPRYKDLDENGKGKLPPGGFKFEVEVNGQRYCSSQGSLDKKKAKVECAKFCLVSLGYKF